MSTSITRSHSSQPGPVSQQPSALPAAPAPHALASTETAVTTLASSTARAAAPRAAAPPAAAAAAAAVLGLVRGRRPRPRRVLVYGTPGIGKSTFATNAPDAVVIQTEDGLDEIDCQRFPQARQYSDVLDALSRLYRGDHRFRTVVIDSLDWLERLIWEAVCRDRQVATIEDIPYGKGYLFAQPLWRDVLDGLNALRAERGMHVVLVAHARIERFENPETEAYDRYVPRLHKTATALITEWCDEVLFASYQVFTKTQDEGFNRTRVQALGSGERVLRTTERPSHLAKNRLNLPHELPLAWSEFATFLPPAALGAVSSSDTGAPGGASPAPSSSTVSSSTTR